MSINYKEYTEAFFQNLAKQEVELAVNKYLGKINCVFVIASGTK
ncbi:MAG: hypothetical protein AAF915_02075 [Cyanobacteria bacterium P01_D01_bin.50]